MGNSKTIYRFEIPKFNYVQFETIGVSNMKNIVKQLNNDYKNISFNVKRVPDMTIEDYMKKEFPNGMLPKVVIPSKGVSAPSSATVDSFGESINAIVARKGGLRR
jgi:hypothetical protein